MKNKKKLPTQEISEKKYQPKQNDHIPSSVEEIEGSGGVREPEAGATGIRESIE